MVRVHEFVCFLIKSHFTYSWFQVIPPSDSLTLHVLKGEQAGGQGYHTAEEDSPDSLAKLSAEPSCLGGHSPICLSVPHLHIKQTRFCVFPSWTALKLSRGQAQGSAISPQKRNALMQDGRPHLQEGDHTDYGPCGPRYFHRGTTHSSYTSVHVMDYICLKQKNTRGSIL